MLCAKSVAPMQDLACSGFHGHAGGRFRRICTGKTRSLRSAGLGDRKGRARKDAIFDAKKAARQAGAACCHSVGGRRLYQSSTRPTYRLSCGCSTTNASYRRMNAGRHGRQVGPVPFSLHETRARPIQPPSTDRMAARSAGLARRFLRVEYRILSRPSLPVSQPCTPQTASHSGAAAAKSSAGLPVQAGAR